MAAIFPTTGRYLGGKSTTFGHPQKSTRMSLSAVLGTIMLAHETNLRVETPVTALLINAHIAFPSFLDSGLAMIYPPICLQKMQIYPKISP